MWDMDSKRVKVFGLVVFFTVLAGLVIGFTLPPRFGTIADWLLRVSFGVLMLEGAVICAWDNYRDIKRGEVHLFLRGK